MLNGNICRTLFVLIFIFININNVNAVECEKNRIDDKFLGIHIHRFHDIKMLPQYKFRSWRLWDAGVMWRNIQPEKNVWDFSRLDLAVIIAQRYDLELTLTLGGSPAWASSDRNRNSVIGYGATSPPADLEDWANYIKVVGKRYSGYINNFEIWNEPDTAEFYTGSVANMVEMTNIASDILKKINKDIVIISPSPSKVESLEWFNEFVKGGGINNVDVVGYHFYSQYSNDLHKTKKFYDDVKEIVSSSNRKIPIWNTEQGLNVAEFDSKDSREKAITNSMLLSACFGAQRYFYYSWDHSDLGFVDPISNKAILDSKNVFDFFEKNIGKTIKSCDKENNQIICKFGI